MHVLAEHILTEQEDQVLAEQELTEQELREQELAEQVSWAASNVRTIRLLLWNVQENVLKNIYELILAKKCELSLSIIILNI